MKFYLSIYLTSVLTKSNCIKTIHPRGNKIFFSESESKSTKPNIHTLSCIGNSTPNRGDQSEMPKERPVLSLKFYSRAKSCRTLHVPTLPEES